VRWIKTETDEGGIFPRSGHSCPARGRPSLPAFQRGP